MKRKNNDKLVEIINDFKKIIIEKPSLSQMFEEVRMMKFKIHPIRGDIADLNLKNTPLIEILWRLGKLDDLFQNKYKKLTSKEKRLLIHLLDSLFYQLQEQLNNITFKTDALSSYSSLLEMEIYKEKPIKN